jgi:hypothetical protein
MRQRDPRVSRFTLVFTLDSSTIITITTNVCELSSALPMILVRLRADLLRHGYRAAQFEEVFARFLPPEPNIRTLKRRSVEKT